jgi:hypothetical protein
MLPYSYTVMYPGTVVVKSLHTLITVLAMPHVVGSAHLAVGTHKIWVIFLI